MNPDVSSTSRIPTYTGRLVDVLNLNWRDICIEDIAHALSNYCRFTGHVRHHYSVAQHSILVSHVVPQRFALHGLLHDASEAYLGDISRPLKYSDVMAKYRILERRTQETINGVFGLTINEPKEVKHADNVVLATELRDLFDRVEENLGLPEPMKQPIQELGPKTAERMFLERYKELTK